MTEAEREKVVRYRAAVRCRSRHPHLFDGMASSENGPPCGECLEEVKREYEMKRAKAHGRELSPEEAALVRKRLGLE